MGASEAEYQTHCRGSLFLDRMIPQYERGLFYEEFRVGLVVESHCHVVTATEIAQFAALTSDTNPLHTDPGYALESGFQGVLAHGPLIQALAIGLIAQTGVVRGTTLALLEVSSSFHHPVLAGDEIAVSMR